MAEFKQELPPAGGYAPITYKRVPLNKPLGLLVKAGIVLGISAFGWIMLNKTRDILNIEKIEMRCATIAIQPMLEAESDRAYLKQLRKNREYEEKLMKDVKGWEVGKYKGSPVYLSLGPDEYFKPHPQEYYAHSPKKHFTFVSTILQQN